jgi:ribosome-associated translation inhibitor RaiA
MQIQINTDKNIEGHERVESHYTSELEKAFRRFEERISRIEVHFSDENSAKSGVDDKKCLIEVRMAGVNPIAASSFGDSTEKAFSGAVDKIKKMMDNTFEKARDH